MKAVPETHDLDRLREEYAERSRRGTDSQLYSFFNPSYLFAIQQRQRLMLDLLKTHGYDKLHEMTILEVGCGSGKVLAEFVHYGASPSQTHGIDLLPNRLYQAQKRLCQSPIICADGQSLPFRSNTYDLVLQFTALSSVLDDTVKQRMAAEMLRVLKPTGAILWYDFWLNPTNPQTKGIRKSEIRRLFPDCKYTFRQITLAPPLARRLVPISWTVASLMDKLRVLNTHYLVLIRPREN